MTSTHSSIFIDVSKPHATIIRLEKDEHFATKLVSRDLLHFNEEERTRLSMVRSCNPAVNEFFFADIVLLVEGDIEQLVFKTPLKSADLEHKHHIVNCLGKGNLQLFSKILTHFKSKYIAIHDSDSPKTQRQNNWIVNGAWTTNSNILNTCALSTKQSCCIAQIPIQKRQALFGLFNIKFS
jgi:predicted ATP-dependent endonuclease of OLD family